MTSRPAKHVVAIVLMTVACSVATATQTADVCDGTFTVAGSTAQLRFAAAAIDPVFSDSTKDYVRVVLSDVKLPVSAVTDDFALQKLTADKKLHAVVLIIAPTQQVASTQLYDAGFQMDSVSSAGTNNQFEAKTLTRSRV